MILTSLELPAAIDRLVSILVLGSQDAPVGGVTLVMAKPDGGVILAEPSWFGDVLSLQRCSVNSTLDPVAATGFGSMVVQFSVLLADAAEPEPTTPTRTTTAATPSVERRPRADVSLDPFDNWCVRASLTLSSVRSSVREEKPRLRGRRSLLLLHAIR